MDNQNQITIQGRINQAYQDIQNLQIQPTKHNIRLMADAMEQMEKAVEEMNSLAALLQQAQQKQKDAERRKAEGAEENVVPMLGCDPESMAEADEWAEEDIQETTDPKAAEDDAWGNDRTGSCGGGERE